MLCGKLKNILLRRQWPPRARCPTHITTAAYVSRRALRGRQQPSSPGRRRWETVRARQRQSSPEHRRHRVRPTPVRRGAKNAERLEICSGNNLAQFATQDLAGGRARDGLHKVNFAGLFVMGETIGDETPKLCVKRGRRCKAFAEHNKSAGNFSSGEVRFGDHAAVTHGRMLEQNRFDLGRGDWKSFVLDHLFAAIKDVIKTFGAAAHDIAGKIPAIAEYGGSSLRLFPVSHHDLGAAHNKLAGFVGADVFVFAIDIFVSHSHIQNPAVCHGYGLSDRSRTVHFGRCDKANVGDRGSFCHSVSLIDEDAGEVGKSSSKIGSKWRSAAFDPADFVLLGKNSSFDGLAKYVNGRRY